MRWCFTHEGRELLLHPGCCAVGFTYQDGCSGTCDIGTTMRVVGPVYQVDKTKLAHRIDAWTYEPEGETTPFELLDEWLVEVGEDNECVTRNCDHVYDGDSVFCAVCGISRGEVGEEQT